MTWRWRVVVTNDDGIESPGLRALAATLSKDFEVIVAAPISDMSGSGTGIGPYDLAKGVDLTPFEMDEVAAAFGIDGPPGLAVTAAALGAFGSVPDLIASGINAGINTGHSVIHSGTVGAALTANTFSIKGLAISLAESDSWRWNTAAEFARAAARWLIERTHGPHVLNVNVPGVTLDDIAGVHWADLDEFGYFQVATAEANRLQFAVRSTENKSDPASDTVLCSQNYVTVTPLTTVEPAPFPDVEAQSILSSYGHDRR